MHPHYIEGNCGCTRSRVVKTSRARSATKSGASGSTSEERATSVQSRSMGYLVQPVREVGGGRAEGVHEWGTGRVVPEQGEQRAWGVGQFVPQSLTAPPPYPCRRAIPTQQAGPFIIPRPITHQAGRQAGPFTVASPTNKQAGITIRQSPSSVDREARQAGRPIHCPVTHQTGRSVGRPITIPATHQAILCSKYALTITETKPRH